MELPAYRLPTLYGIITHTWDRVWQFVKKAGTVIFAISIVIWAFMTFPQLPQKQKVYFNKMRREVVLQSKNLSKERNHAALSKIANLEQETALKHSYGGRMGVWLERVSKYVGFPWQANIALIGGFAAKEVILSTLSTAYSLGDPDNEEAISTSQGRNSTEQSGIISSSMLGRKLLTNSAWTLPMVISFLLFVLLYTPCFVTIITIAKESSWMWALLGTFASLAFTYALCVIVYQVCSVFM